MAVELTYNQLADYVDDIYIKTSQLLNELERYFLPGIEAPAQLDLKAEILHRVQQTGKGADGKTYQYSEKPILVSPSDFNKTQLNDLLNSFPSKESKGKSKFSKKKIPWRTTKTNKKLILLDGGYKELREIKLGSSRTRFVDLDFDTPRGPNKLLDSLFVVMDKVSATRYDFKLISISDEGRKKFASAIKKFPTLLQASPSEVEWFRGQIINWLNQNYYA